VKTALNTELAAMIEQQAALDLVAQAGAEDNFGRMMAEAGTAMKTTVDALEKIKRIQGEM